MHGADGENKDRMDQRQREDRGGSNKERPRKRGASQNGSETEVRFRRWGKLLTEVRFTRWGKLLTELDLRGGENNPKKFLSSERCKIFSGQRGRNARARQKLREPPRPKPRQRTQSYDPTPRRLCQKPYETLHPNTEGIASLFVFRSERAFQSLN